MKKKKAAVTSTEEDLGIFDIDENNLDKELVRQPKLLLQYIRQVVDARDLLDRRKALVDVTAADLDKSIREDPDSYGLEKVTEAAVKAAILGHDDYIDAQKKVRQAKHKVATLEGYISVLEHRKRMLEKLVDLHGMGYFASPRTKPSLPKMKSRE